MKLQVNKQITENNYLRGNYSLLEKDKVCKKDNFAVYIPDLTHWCETHAVHEAHPHQQIEAYLWEKLNIGAMVTAKAQAHFITDLKTDLGYIIAQQSASAILANKKPMTRAKGAAKTEQNSDQRKSS